MQPVVLYEDNHCLAVAKPAPLLMQGVPYGPPRWKPGHAITFAPSTPRRATSIWEYRIGSTGRSRASSYSRAALRRRLASPSSFGTIKSRRCTGHSWTARSRRQRDVGRLRPQGARRGAGRDSRPGLRRSQIRGDGFWGDRPTRWRYAPRTPAQDRTDAPTPPPGRSRGWPIRGDELYGSQRLFGPPGELQRDRVIALHARSLTFLHPIRYDSVTVEADLPGYWPAGIDDRSGCAVGVAIPIQPGKANDAIRHGEHQVDALVVRPRLAHGVVALVDGGRSPLPCSSDTPLLARRRIGTARRSTPAHSQFDAWEILLLNHSSQRGRPAGRADRA